MLGDDGFENAVTDNNKATDKETDDDHFVSFESLEAEERNLGIEQITADKR